AGGRTRGLHRGRSGRSVDCRRVGRGSDGQRHVLSRTHSDHGHLRRWRMAQTGFRRSAAGVSRGDAEALVMNAVEILRELVAIDSTSARSNLPMIDALERHARGLGFSTRRQAWTDPAGVPKANLIASRGGETGGLALVGHTDCVPFDRDWSGALRAEEREGKLFARGAADTKAFIAAALEAASRTSAGPLQLVFTADEEVGCLGARKLVDARAFRPRYALVGEPTRLT